jgi:hypothetical protein
MLFYFELAFSSQFVTLALLKMTFRFDPTHLTAYLGLTSFYHTKLSHTKNQSFFRRPNQFEFST